MHFPLAPIPTETHINIAVLERIRVAERQTQMAVQRVRAPEDAFADLAFLRREACVAQGTAVQADVVD